MTNRKESKHVFYPKGTDSGKPALMFQLKITNNREYKSMTVSERIMLVQFLNDCIDSIRTWQEEEKETVGFHR